MKKEATIILLLLLIFPLVTAEATTINIKTIPLHEVQVTPFNANSVNFQALASFKNYSNPQGEINFTFDTTVPAFNLVIFIKQYGETVVTQKYLENYKPGEDIYIEIAPSDYEFPEESTDIEIETPEETNNETQETNETLLEQDLETLETENIENENSEEQKGLTGFAVFGEDSIVSNYKYYLISFAFLLAIIAGVMLKHKFYKKTKTSDGTGGVTQKIKTRKLSELQEKKQESLGEMDDQIKEAEEKIKQAQKVIDKLKKQEEIKKAEKKLEEDRKALEKLKDIKEDIEDED